MVPQQCVQWQEEGDTDLSEVMPGSQFCSMRIGVPCASAFQAPTMDGQEVPTMSACFSLLRSYKEELQMGQGIRSVPPQLGGWALGALGGGTVSREVLDGGEAETPTGPCREMLPLTSSSWAHSTMPLPKFHLPMNEPLQARPSGHCPTEDQRVSGLCHWLESGR